MSHTVRGKVKLIARVRRLRGQMEAIERALESEVPCGEVLNQVASVRGALGGLTAELIEAHLREHVVAAADRSSAEMGAGELIEVIRRYMR